MNSETTLVGRYAGLLVVVSVEGRRYFRPLDAHLMLWIAFSLVAS